MNYDNMLIKADKKGLEIKEKIFKSDAKGLIKGNKILLNKKIDTQREKACILAEEIAHRELTVGNIIDQRCVSNRKQERRARELAYNELIGLQGIIETYEAGCKNLYTMAKYLDVTEEFLHEALVCYKDKYGLCVKVDNYIIYFDPSLGVLKLI